MKALLKRLATSVLTLALIVALLPLAQNFFLKDEFQEFHLAVESFKKDLDEANADPNVKELLNQHFKTLDRSVASVRRPLKIRQDKRPAK